MRVRINKPTASQKKVVADEFYKLLDQFNYDTNVQIFYILHFTEGYGIKRLKRVAKEFIKLQKMLKERYELVENDTTWFCENQLKESGINVEELLKGAETD